MNGNTGLWKMGFQRGYWFDSENILYKQARGPGDEWYVFGEEYESLAIVKKFERYNKDLYDPSGSLSGYFNPKYQFTIENARIATDLPRLLVGSKVSTRSLNRLLIPSEDKDYSSDDDDTTGNEYYEFEVTPTMVGKDYTFIASSNDTEKYNADLDITSSAFMPILSRKDVNLNNGWRYLYNSPKPGVYYIRVHNDGSIPYNPNPVSLTSMVNVEVIAGNHLE